jgi:NIMA (never in mitosis gene a)-related kinase
MSLNDFEIIKVIHNNTLTKVFLVNRKEDNIHYALKQIKISQHSPTEQTKLLNAYKHLTTLTHPNILNHHETFIDNETNTINILMEYIPDSNSIAHKLKVNRMNNLVFQESELWQWLIQMLQGLQYLHSCGVVHKHLTCGDLLLTSTGMLKISGFMAQHKGFRRTEVGNDCYVPPEVWKGKVYSYKSDVWNVGCIMYELCTMFPPFKGTTLKELNNNVLRGVYMPVPNRYSFDLRKVIQMMLIVNPSKRIAVSDVINCGIVQKKYTAGGNEIESTDDDAHVHNNNQQLRKRLTLPGYKLSTKQYVNNTINSNHYYPTSKYTYNQRNIFNDKSFTELNVNKCQHINYKGVVKPLTTKKPNHRALSAKTHIFHK